MMRVDAAPSFGELDALAQAQGSFGLCTRRTQPVSAWTARIARIAWIARVPWIAWTAWAARTARIPWTARLAWIAWISRVAGIVSTAFLSSLIVSLLFVLSVIGLSLFVSSFLGCAPSRESKEALVEVTLWHSYTGLERGALESAVRAFEETSPRVRVTLTAVPPDALKLTAAIPRGHGPDLFIYAHDRVGGWAEGGLVQPIELFVTEEDLDAHLSPCVFALTYGESLFALPLAYKALALYVRTDLVPKPPESFDDLLRIAKAATHPREGRYGFVYGNADLFMHAPLLVSLGGFIFENADDSRRNDRPVNVVNDGVIRSFALAHRLAKEEGVVPEEPNPVTASAMFADGRGPLVVSGPWFRSEIPASVPYTVVPIPAFPGGTASSGFSTCEGVYMSSRSKHPAEAWTVMRFLANDARSAAVRIREAGQPVTLRRAYEDTVRELPAQEQAILMGFRTAFERAIPSPSDPSMAAVWLPMNASLYRVIHKGSSPTEAAREAQRRIEQALVALRR